MLTRIELINYMCHPRTVIEPAEGLTVLAGPNNCGKSAVVVALRTLCENIRGDFMVKHGESDCRVRVETNEGHELEWRRKSGTVSYKINGREVHRLQGSVPEDLHELLRLPKVSSPKEGDTYDVHFARQKSPIFLLDQPGGHAARFFASSSDAALLMKMQEKHKEKAREKRGEKTVLVKETERLEGLLEQLEPVEKIDSELESAEGEYKKLVDRQERIESLDSDIEVLSEQLNEVEHISAQVDILEEVAAPPKLVDTIPLETLIADLGEAKAALSKEEKKGGLLADLDQPPELHDVEPLEKLCEDLRRQLRQKNRLNEKVECYKTLSDPPDLRDTEPLEDLLTRLRDAKQDVAQCEARLSAFDSLEEVPTPEDTETLSNLVGEIQEVAETVEAYESDAESAERNLRTIEKEIRRWAKDHPICPTCGAKVDPERLVSAGGVHNHADG